MLKERKCKRPKFVWRDIRTDEITKKSDEYIYGYCSIEGCFDTLYALIEDDNIVTELNSEEYFLCEVKSSVFDSDYHTYGNEIEYNGVFLAFNLANIDTKKYFGKDIDVYDKKELINLIESILSKYNLIDKYNSHEVTIEDKGYLRICIENQKLDSNILNCSKEILSTIRNFYSKNNVHITRMFGSYILLRNVDDKLKAIKATPIPIKYCPLMIKLLKEVGGDLATKLIQSLSIEDEEKQCELMCDLINKVVIDSGYFDSNRPLNSCESNVLFGASETIYSAFQNNLIDAAVIVSNNLGTIITTNAPSTQGAVKRMTGLFYTSPNQTIVNTALKENIIPVFPYTAEIDQLEGVKKAIELGYKRIAVSLAAHDNILHEKLDELAKNHNITLYKFGLCSTGIDEITAMSMKDHADVIWSCASKQVKNHIEPNAIAQVGIKIPVHIMTNNGWTIVKNHLELMGESIDISLNTGDDKPIILNSNNKLKILTKKDLKNCSDCPNPCI